MQFSWLVFSVTTCGNATDALSLLREDINKFDLVISDVFMPDMDGFRLLELVGLEMDLLVISKCPTVRVSISSLCLKGCLRYLVRPLCGRNLDLSSVP